MAAVHTRYWFSSVPISQKSWVRIPLKSEFFKALFSQLLCYVHTVFSRLNAPGVYLKFDSFHPAFFRGRRLIGVRRLLMKCHFQPFFQVDLLLPILGNLGAVYQCWTIFPCITRSYSFMVPYIRHVYHVAIKICITNKQHINNI